MHASVLPACLFPSCSSACEPRLALRYDATYRRPLGRQAQHHSQHIRHLGQHPQHTTQHTSLAASLTSWGSVPESEATLQFEVAGAHVSAPVGRPRGIVHFIGGAFAGAAPQLLYPLLIELITEAGFTVISTPFAVTFKHLDCAQLVHKKFTGCVAELRRSGRAHLVPEDVPVHGLGHSNGALLHLLIGSLFQPMNTSNIVIAFNNRPVKDAIPVALDGLQAAVRTARASPFASALPSANQLISRAASALAPTGLALDERMVASLLPALDQFNSVLDEVGDGTMEFTPTPSASRELIRSSYIVPYTLLLRFANDNIDETPEMAAALRAVNAQGTVEMVLPGTHVTPCGGDVKWEVGKGFSPFDAVALSVKQATQADLRRLAGRIIDWLNGQ
ncbi:hypothetical protein WJX72_006952 [[Myrmecia] bisecta]|uniref:DUF1350-domain-containing protein n=1 Tax=[Myrmecia] bisecta TaxID=41462 RepID=A0AAW1PFK3_9CHLO